MIGERLGKWRIFKELGRGGMGRVYLAQEEGTGRQAALKVLADATARVDAVGASSAAGHYTKSLVLANELGMRPLVAHCHAGLHKLYRHTGKRSEADLHGATASTMYSEMAMTYWSGQMERDT